MNLNKKGILMTILGLAATMILSGCGGSTVEEYIPDQEILYLVDQDGYAVAGIQYDCTLTSGETGNDGSFLLYPGELCTLFLDYPVVDSTIDILHIEDRVGGIRDVEYICENGNFGRTDDLGRFNFDNIYEDDICDFLL